MVYYKILIVDGVFDYPAGCVLCCAYPQSIYMYCQFLYVSKVGDSWVEITESEFYENYVPPESPAAVSYARRDEVGISDFSFQYGEGSIAGVKGFYWSAIDVDAKTVTLSTVNGKFGTEQEFDVSDYWAVGDVITIHSNQKWNECSTITAISGKTITVDSLPFTTPTPEQKTFADNAVFVPAKVEAGLVDFGLYAFAYGLMCRVVNFCATAFGYKIEVLGQYGFGAGRDHKIGHAAAGFGRGNTVTGEQAFAAGCFNIILANLAAAFGRGNTATQAARAAFLAGIGLYAASELQHIIGKYNEIDVDGLYAFILGNGEDEDNRSNAMTVDWKGNAWFAGDVAGHRVVIEGTSDDNYWPRVRFLYDGAEIGYVDLSPDSRQLRFIQRASDSGKNEIYNLPTPKTGMTAAKQYQLLTTRDAVTIAQGGTGATTAANARTKLGVAHAIESPTYPGCYYRTVNGLVEWINPPMVFGVEYRTTERHNGMAVYTKMIDVGYVYNAVDVTTPTHTEMIRWAATGYCGNENNRKIMALNSTAYGAFSVDIYDDVVYVYADDALGGMIDVEVQLWYTKD